MGVFVVTPPTEKLVALDLVKTHCGIDAGDEDALLNQFIAAVTDTLDGPGGDSGYAFLPQRLEARMACFGSPCFELPYPALRDEATIEIQYFDPDNAQRTLDPATYYVARPSRDAAYLFPAPGKFWPAVARRPDAVRVQYDAGFEALPERVAQAALLMVADLYENRETFILGDKVTLTDAAARLMAAFWRPIIA